MTVEFLTGNTLASALGVPGMRITRAVRRHAIVPDAFAGRTLLFRESRLPTLRAQLGVKTLP